LAETTTDEEVDAQVEAASATVLDAKLHDRLFAEFHARLKSQLQAIASEASDEAVRAKLNEVLRESTYDAAWAKLQEVLPDVQNGDAAAYAKLKDLRKEEDDRLSVTYMLENEQGRTKRQGVVTEIHKSAELRGDEGNTVLIKVAIDKNEIPHLRSGATVNAQVYCGQRSLGYVLLHDVGDFIQSRILFRYF
jgi:hypothetical protein